MSLVEWLAAPKSKGRSKKLDNRRKALERKNETRARELGKPYVRGGRYTGAAASLAPKTGKAIVRKKLRTPAKTKKTLGKVY